MELSALLGGDLVGTRISKSLAVTNAWKLAIREAPPHCWNGWNLAQATDSRTKQGESVFIEILLGLIKNWNMPFKRNASSSLYRIEPPDLVGYDLYTLVHGGWCVCFYCYFFGKAIRLECRGSYRKVMPSTCTFVPNLIALQSWCNNLNDEVLI